MTIQHQCELGGVSRSGGYYRPQGESELNLELMQVIDAQYLLTPWYGSRQMTRHLCRRGYAVARQRVRRLLRLMGLRSLAPQPGTSRRAPRNRVYPYLLGDLTVARPNQVWCAYVTYIPMAHKFLYLVAIMDWHLRMVLSWRLSNTLDTSFCLEALGRYGRLEIFNTDQGSQFTGGDWTGMLKAHSIQISMDGKGRWTDNVFIDRAAGALAEVRMRVPAGFRGLPRRHPPYPHLDALLQ